MMTDKVKDSLRKALEHAMQNSENITITQSNKVIAEVRDKEEPKPPAPCKIPKDILNVCVYTVFAFLICLYY